jgi:membrane protein required for colicin V production
MNHIDIILAIPLTIGAIRGFSRGFILELASLAGILIGVFLAALFSGLISELLLEYVDWNQNAMKIVAFIIIFIFVVITVKIIGRLIEKFFKLIGLNFLNRLAGLVAGGLKFAFILSVVLIFFNYINREELLMSKETQDESFLYNPVASLVPSILPGQDFLNFEEIIDKVRNDEFQ